MTAAGLVAAGGVLTAMPVSATDSAPFTATIPVITYSLTVSPSSATYGTCSRGNSTANALGFPNGACQITGITVTNTSTASIAHIDVEGSAANPSDGGTAWTLSPYPPGQDQFAEDTGEGAGFFGGINLTTSPQCDTAFNPGFGVLDKCGASPNQAQPAEALGMVGPTKSSDASASFTTTVTWIVVQ